jgi:hypothetical protein
MRSGIELIAQERQEQIEKHGRTVELDVANNRGRQLSEAAAVLATELFQNNRRRLAMMPDNWDEELSFKMCRKGRVERLAIAGALIAAEIDRLQSIEATTG